MKEGESEQSRRYPVCPKCGNVDLAAAILDPLRHSLSMMRMFSEVALKDLNRGDVEEGQELAKWVMEMASAMDRLIVWCQNKDIKEGGTE